MAIKKQGITTGSGVTKPILAGKDHTAEGLKPSQASTSIAEGSTKPVSIQEALSLLQTICLDLRAMGSEVSILAKDKRVYVVIEVPASIGKMGMKDGHITENGLPVSESMIKSIYKVMNTAGLEPLIPK